MAVKVRLALLWILETDDEVAAAVLEGKPLSLTQYSHLPHEGALVSAFLDAERLASERRI